MAAESASAGRHHQRASQQLVAKPAAGPIFPHPRSLRMGTLRESNSLSGADIAAADSLRLFRRVLYRLSLQAVLVAFDGQGSFAPFSVNQQQPPSGGDAANRRQGNTFEMAGRLPPGVEGKEQLVVFASVKRLIECRAREYRDARSPNFGAD